MYKQWKLEIGRHYYFIFTTIAAFFVLYCFACFNNSSNMICNYFFNRHVYVVSDFNRKVFLDKKIGHNCNR